MYSFKFNEETVYVPVHMNATFKSKYLSFSVDLIDDTLASDILRSITNSTAKYFLVDLTNVNAAHSRVFEPFSQIRNLGKNLIFCGADEKISGHIAKALSITIVGNGFLFSTKEAEVYFETVVKGKVDFKQKLDRFVKSVTAEFLLTTARRTSTFLDSSNVYSNMYIDIKQMFCNTPVYFLTLYLLCRLLTREKNLDQYDGFICASNNGSVISTALTILIGKPTIYLMNLGPHLTIMDREVIGKIKEGGRYLFVYDFLCLGTELKLVKTVVALQGATIEGSFGIAKLFLPSNPSSPRKYDTTNHSVISINEEFEFNYEVSAT
ncbi:hypothetical protein [Geomonas ferrireducens]|uniref:hypothetical protein n=1 Tax=Geomonas ferrireducens TaxID=2570227 RepID=UPI0010A825C4|nr:hypothetical protein [Geomonas ferrireducens]